MSADEATRGTEVDESRVRTGPRHAAPRKPLFTRFHVPAGKAVAIAAMPTAVLMGMGFTPTLAQADDHSSSKSLTIDEYQKCVEAMTGAKDGKDASATPTPSASTSASSTASPGTAKPTPSASASPDKTSSSDSGSDDKAGSEPTPSASKSAQSGSGTGGDEKPAATPSASTGDGGLLGAVGDAITGVLTGGGGSTASSTPTPSATPSASTSASAGDTQDKGASGTVKDTAGKVTDTVKKAVKDTTDTATKAAEDTTKAVKDATDAATSSPSPSASATTDLSDCPVATDAEGGVDNRILLPDDPWYLNASSLLLKGADYQGVVKVKTASGKVKRVLKYVISDGTDIGDLHQTVNDEQSGRTYHVQAGKGTTSTIRDGKTIMYTESISGNLLGLIPITFDPDNPPPLNIPLIYFTKVKVVQAGQFGGTLTVPGLHQYTS
ncbi:hypothetical protein ACFVTC_37725 [Streptomyces sp. NPDC057950]|uniref:hypothetical protein n=1 Tax=Streptomyces sp. NPDC057950 TaxID=3346288 RepID=UPI0036E966BF